ncbi:MAG TPA: UbiH/UbiF/VisC/COQ6 family ubiquinone biosynthesis hydroxylase [Burkholderiaceae bacterium]|jgi:2-octaprenyl-6-methoxyphenol hydroxylase
MNPVDIAICGAGPVGLALAQLLTQQGVSAEKIALIDAKGADQAAADPRSIALSYGSRQILEQLGAWPIAADAIHQIHVSRRGHFGRTLIDREELDVPALGYVARYGNVVAALDRRVAQSGIQMLRPVRVDSLEESDDRATLRLSDGAALQCRVAIQAEGGLFEQQTEKSVRRDYGQTAIVAQVWSSAPIAHRAFERFTEDGPLALLPQDEGYALVWCTRPDHALSLLALPDAEFLAALGVAFGMRVGRFIRTTPRFSFVLGLNAQASATARTLAIGNAAQTLHPVAGQGLNLGLRDAVVLAQCLRDEPAPYAVQRFIARRQADRFSTIRLTDTLARIFASAPDGAASQSALGAALGLVDIFKPAKSALAEQMMFGSR